MIYFSIFINLKTVTLSLKQLNKNDHMIRYKVSEVEITLLHCIQKEAILNFKLRVGLEASKMFCQFSDLRSTLADFELRSSDFKVQMTAIEQEQ